MADSTAGWSSTVYEKDTRDSSLPSLPAVRLLVSEAYWKERDLSEPAPSAVGLMHLLLSLG